MFNSRITSLAFSDLGTYSIDYLTNGNIDTITYPNSQGEETYTYGGGKGRLSQIEYPNDDTLEFLWNDKDEVSRITYTDYTTQTETRYTMTYTPNHEVSTLTQSIDSMQQYVWTFSWAPNGLEKVVKTINGQPVLTQDFTTDPQGRILSMTYDTAGEGYDGELYFHYDHFGNTTLLTDEEGDPVASFEYDLHSGKIINEWSPEGLEVVNLGEGMKGNVLIVFHENCLINLLHNTIIIKSILNRLSASKKSLSISLQPCNGGECPSSDCCALMQNFINASLRRSHWRNQYNQFDSTGTYEEYVPKYIYVMFDIKVEGEIIDEATWKEKKRNTFWPCIAMGGSLVECLYKSISFNPKQEMKEHCKNEMEKAEKEANDLCEQLCSQNCDDQMSDFYAIQEKWLGTTGNMKCHCNDDR